MGKLVKVLEAITNIRQMKQALQSAGPNDVIEYPDELIEKAPFELRKAIADHNTQAMPDGHAYRDSFGDETWYHATNKDFDRFELNAGGGAAEAVGQPYLTKDSIYFADKESHAENFGRNIGEYRLRGDAHVVDAKAALSDWAEDQGYPSAQSMLDEYYDGDLYEALDLDGMAASAKRDHSGDRVALDFGDLKGSNGVSGALAVESSPSNIRSVSAAFDPAKRNSTNILASAAPAAVGLGALSGENEALAAPTAMDYLQHGSQPEAEAKAARFPALHKLANAIDGYQDPSGIAIDTSGLADYLRQFGERGSTLDKLIAAFGAQPI